MTVKKIIYIKFVNMPISMFQIPKFRGAIGHQFRDFDILHNHLENDRLAYRYPSIQYKIINKKPCIVGFETGRDVLHDVFFDLQTCQIGEHTYTNIEKEIVEKHCTISQIKELQTYTFLHPWMALNQKNHQIYKNSNWVGRKQLLTRILRGNIMSLSKGMGYTIPHIDDVEIHLDVQEQQRKFKNNSMICFSGKFAVNFEIPNYLGLGKQTSRGFGTIRKDVQ